MRGSHVVVVHALLGPESDGAAEKKLSTIKQVSAIS